MARIANGEWVIQDPSAPQPEAAAQAEATSERPIKALAPLIDAMLLAGNMTMRGILRELQRRASSACHGRDIRANVRVRLYWLTRRGYSAGLDAQGRLHVR